MLDLPDDRVQRAVDVVRRALIAHRDVRFLGDELAERLDDARLADARFSRKQDDLSLTVNRLLPTIVQQRHLLLPADEVREVHDMGGETARCLLLAHHPPDRHRLHGALELAELEFIEHEDVADEPPRRVGNENLIRPCLGLEMGREIGRLAYDGLFLGQRSGTILAYDDQAGGDTDPDLQFVRAVRRPYRADDGQRGVDRPLGIVFVGTRISEQRHDAVADIIRDQAVELVNRVGATVVIAPRDGVEIFRIERLRKRGRPNDVAEENGKVSPLAAGNETARALLEGGRHCRNDAIGGPRSSLQARTAAAAKFALRRVDHFAVQALGG